MIFKKIKIFINEKLLGILVVSLVFCNISFAESRKISGDGTIFRTGIKSAKDCFDQTFLKVTGMANY